MRAIPEVLEDHRVRLSVEVDADEVDEAVAAAARSLARELRIPGFRPGRAPRQVIEARLGGPNALRGEALRDLLPDYYARALSVTELEPVSPPELNLTAGAESGAVAFDAVVEVRPELSLEGYGALRVTIPSPLPNDAEVEQLLDQLREPDAELATVNRPIVTGDYVTMDVQLRQEDGDETRSFDDFVYLVGQGSIVDAADEQLPGMRAGETLEVVGNAPGGGRLACTLALKEVRERVLPELTDEWVRENTDLASVQELRDRTLERIRATKLAQARAAVRDATLGALTALVADDEVPQSMLDAEVASRREEFEQRLAASKVTVEQYLAATRLSEEDLGGMLRSDAVTAIKVDLALRAVAAAEDLDPTAEELDAEVARLAELRKQRPEKLREELQAAGRMGALRSGTAKAKASTWILERAVFVDETGATIDRGMLGLDDDEVREEAEERTPGPAEALDQSPPSPTPTEEDE